MRVRLSTSRLVLRPWTGGDLTALTAINADPQVNAWLGGETLAARSADALQTMQDRLDANGWGVLAVCGAEGELLGLAGLQPLAPPLPIAPGVEAVWRLRRSAWGYGYAREAMQAILTSPAVEARLEEIVALVAKPNLKSVATAQGLGFRHDPTADFLHPALAADHPLRPHRVYRKTVSHRDEAEGDGCEFV